MSASNITTGHWSSHALFKLTRIIPQHFCSLMIEGVIWIRILKNKIWLATSNTIHIIMKSSEMTWWKISANYQWNDDRKSRFPWNCAVKARSSTTTNYVWHTITTLYIKINWSSRALLCLHPELYSRRAYWTIWNSFELRKILVHTEMRHESKSKTIDTRFRLTPHKAKSNYRWLRCQMGKKRSWK